MTRLKDIIGLVLEILGLIVVLVSVLLRPVIFGLTQTETTIAGVAIATLLALLGVAIMRRS